MHSTPISEPLGAIAGVIGGAIGSLIGGAIGEAFGDSAFAKTLGTTAGATAGHYLASASTKAIVSTLLLDPAGAAVGVSVTSPATSLIHGAAVFSAEVDW